MSHILSGLRVIDCGTYIAGPAAAVIMSDFGAEVIKIERPPAGDPYRMLYRLPGMALSPIDYNSMLDGRNKRSLALDLGDEACPEALLKLVASADVFITNYQPQLVKKFRLGFEDLQAVNPKLIYAQVTGYGEIGPEADKPGYDMTGYWARSGLMGIMYNADAEPTRSPCGFGDHPTSMSLFAAIMLGLYQRNLTGMGCKVSTSLMANGAWSNSCQIQAALCKASAPERGTRKTCSNPLVNHYLSRDGQRFIQGLDPDLRRHRNDGTDRRDEVQHASRTRRECSRVGGAARSRIRQRGHGCLEAPVRRAGGDLGAGAVLRASPG